MPRDVRRRATRGLAAAVAAGLLVGLSGCAGIGQPAPYDSPGINGLVIPTPSPDPDDFVDGVDNPWLPLEPGAVSHFVVTDDGLEIGTIDLEVGDATTEVAGLAATVVRTTSEIRGQSRMQNHFYAQDRAGNVWLVGADSGDDSLSWRAGEADNEAGLAMPADPRLGDGWQTYVVPGLPDSSRTIESQSPQLVQTRDEAGTATRNVYEKGVGLVSVEDLATGWIARRDD